MNGARRNGRGRLDVIREFVIRHRAVVIVAVAAVVLRLLAQAALGSYQDPIGFEEDIVARNIVEGRGYVYELNGAPTYALRAPAYSFLLAAVYWTFGIGSVQAGLAQAVLGGVLALLAYAIGRRVASPLVGALAGVAVAAEPALLLYGARIHPINLDAVLFLSGVILALRIRDAGPSVVDHVLLGLVIGVTVLSRPTFVPALLLAALVVAVRSLAAGRPKNALRGVVTLIVAAAVVAPWSVRNMLVVGTPSLTSSTGLTLWLGNNPAASGGTVTSEGISILDTVPTVRDRIWGKGEFEQDAILTEEAIAYVTSDPGRTARADLGKFLAFWWFSPQTGVFYPRSWLPLAVALQVVVLITTALGIVVLVRRRQWWPLWVMASMAVLAAASQAIFYVDGRHRYAVEPLLVIFSVVGVVGAATGSRARRRSSGTALSRRNDDGEGPTAAELGPSPGPHRHRPARREG